MLSILIPTYNYDCTHLVRALHRQAEKASIDYEIIVADDASTVAGYVVENRAINDLPNCRLVELHENHGRARVRNRLADEARHEWLLFMDADAEVISESFIEDYMKHTDADVVCGGLCHAAELSAPEVSLRYAYEKRADRRRAARYRARHPYERFSTFCFLVKAKVFHDIRFDESIKGYGHEDTLFGIGLKARQVNIRHIDNPIRHVGIETNEIFLEKSRTALHNLATMEGTMQGHSSLLKAYGLLRRIGLDGFTARWFVHKEQALTRHLTGHSPRLGVFFLYKLGYYCKIKRGR